jgi:hypothetical protein
MKKCLWTVVLTITLVNTAFCASKVMKTIVLKGGSTLRGEVIQLKDGIYTLEIPELGRMNIPQSHIVSITSSGASDSPNSQTDNTAKRTKGQIKSQVNQIQGNILSDPDLMTEIQNIIKDEEIQTMLTDPQLLDDVLSYDPDLMQQNDNVQNLLQNKKMQQLMEKIQQKIDAMP